MSSSAVQPLTVLEQQEKIFLDQAHASQTKQDVAVTAGPAETLARSAERPASSATVLPTFDLTEFLEGPSGSEEDIRSFCQHVADCLAQTGCLIVRDPRVGSTEADSFLDMMERYFSQSADIKMHDVHPELHYQVYTTAYLPLEIAACCCVGTYGIGAAWALI